MNKVVWKKSILSALKLTEVYVNISKILGFWAGREIITPCIFVPARSVSEEFSSGCEGRSGSGGGSTGAPADQEHRPDHRHRDRSADDRDEGV